LRVAMSGRKRFVLMSHREMIRIIESPDTTAKSVLKLIVSFCYCALSLFITSFVMVLVDSRVPDMNRWPPLPGSSMKSLGISMV
jgi:hypothetical protein